MESEFSRLCATLTNKCNRLRSNTEQIRTLTEQLGSGHDSEDLRTRLHDRQHDGLRAASELVHSISELETLARDGDRTMKAQAERLSEMIIQTTTSFQAAQRDLVSREREALSRARSRARAPLIDVGDPSDELGLGLGSPTGLHPPGFAPQQDVQTEAEADAAEMAERERAIREIEQDIARVNDLFRDFARVVHEQTDTIDSIAFNVETTQVHYTNASQNLSSAMKHKQSVRRKKCICVVALIVILIIIVLILIFAFAKN